MATGWPAVRRLLSIHNFAFDSWKKLDEKMSYLSSFLFNSFAIGYRRFVFGVQNLPFGTRVVSSNSSSTNSDLPLPEMSNPYEADCRQCILCKNKIVVDYKNPRLLSQFVSPFTGKIYESNITGICKKQQKLVECEIKRSQTAGYMPVMMKKVEYMKDPKICDPNNPLRPHRF